MQLLQNSPPAALAEIAATQLSTFSRSQALDVGWTDATIDRQLAVGAWVRVQRDVYRSSFVAPTWHADLVAAHLGTPASSVSHESAGQLRNLPVPPGRLVLSVPRHTHHTDGLARIHESTDLAPHHIEHIGCLPVTTTARTIVDLAAVLPMGRLARVLDDALSKRTVEHANVCALFTQLRRRGKRGFRVLGALLDERSDGAALSESELEARFRALLWRAGMPEPQWQFRVPWWSSVIGRVDAAYPSRCLVVELDGRRWHSRDQQYDRDRRRDNEALLHGWRVLRFTWQQVVFEPDYVIATLRTALALAA